MEQKESCETQLYSEFNCLSYGSPNRAKNFRKKTVDVEEFHSLLSLDPDKDGKLVKDKDYFDNRIDSCSNEEQYRVLSYNRICYYKNEHDPHPVGIINLSMVDATVEISRKQKLKFSVLITGLKRKFRFKARTQEERNQWCSALITSIENSDS